LIFETTIGFATSATMNNKRLKAKWNNKCEVMNITKLGDSENTCEIWR